MTATLCWLAFLWAVLSDGNKSTGVTILCWLAWASAMMS